MIINDQPIVSHETDFAVRFDGSEPEFDGEPMQIVCSGEVEARATQMTAGGTVVSREVYLTDWAEVDE